MPPILSQIVSDLIFRQRTALAQDQDPHDQALTTADRYLSARLAYLAGRCLLHNSETHVLSGINHAPASRPAGYRCAHDMTSPVTEKNAILGR